MPRNILLTTGLLLAASTFFNPAVAEPAGQPHARRQGQYGSFLNSSISISTSGTPPSSVTTSSDTVHFSYEPESSSQSAQFSYEPETSSSIKLASTTTSGGISSIVSPSRPTNRIPYPSSAGAGISSLPPYPTGSSGFASASPASSYFPITASRIRPPIKHDCAGRTVNAQNAAFDWWNPYTVGHAVSALSYQLNSRGSETGWTIIPLTETFSLTDYFVQYVCDDTPIIVTDTDDNSTWTSYDCSFVPQTVAAATTATTLTAFTKPWATTGTGFDVPDVRYTKPADPSTTFAAVNATFAPSVDFVYFTQYEIEDSDTTTYRNGSEACATTTATYNLTAPYALTYTGTDPWSATDPVAPVTGDLNQDFLAYIGQPTATVGSFTALPTVIVIVVEAFEARVVAAIARTMESVAYLDTPTAQLPSGFSASSTGTDTSNWASDLYTSLTLSARIETSVGVLLVPTVGSSTDAVAASQTAQAGNNNNAAGTGANSGPSSVTDANDVLSQALGPAILQGLGSLTATQTITLAGASATATSVPVVVVSGKTAVAGGAPITVAGETISVASAGSSVVVNGQTQQISSDQTIFSVDGVQITTTKASAYNIAGQTLAAGAQPIIIDGTKLSLVTGGNAIVVGSSTMMLSAPPVITIAARTITGDAADKFIFGPGQTLAPGSIAVIAGTTVSMDSSGTAIVINGQTTSVGHATAGSAQVTSGPVLVVDGQSYSPAKAGGYMVSGQTLLAGGAITFTGKYGVETLSLDRSGSVIVDVVSGKSTTSTMSATAAPITLGNQIFTTLPGTGATYVIGGQTITPGAVKTVTVGGSTYVVSLGSVPTAVVIQTLSGGHAVGTTTETLVATITSGAAIPNKSPTAASNAAATTAPATGQASSMMMEMLTALFGAAALGLAAFL